MTEKLTVHSAHAVEDIILTVRGQKVILDCDLARIYVPKIINLFNFLVIAISISFFFIKTCSETQPNTTD